MVLRYYPVQHCLEDYFLYTIRMSLKTIIYHDGKRPFSPLKKATNIELFFDLVFIFCMRNIIPVVTKTDNLTWHTYATFGFTFLLMLQIWFHVTILINRYGNGKAFDKTILLLIMPILFPMTYAISTTWENYLVYNISWILILLILIAGWLIKMRTLIGLDDADRKIMRRYVLVLSIQALTVLISTLFPSTPMLIGYIVAIIIGFLGWGFGLAHHGKIASFEHLVERCALLVILTFGEMLIGLSSFFHLNQYWISAVFLFTLIVGLFLVYLHHFEYILDHKKQTNGISYMILSAWLVFLLANMTIALEFIWLEKAFFFDSYLYLCLSISLFLLTFRGFSRFSKPCGVMRGEWLAGRIGASIVLFITPPLGYFNYYIAEGLAIAAVFFCLLHEHYLYRKYRPKNENHETVEED